MSALDKAMIAAHAAGDLEGLVRLYTTAAEQSEGKQAAFYLTHAYVFALELGHPDAPALRDKLVEIGSETPLDPS